METNFQTMKRILILLGVALMTTAASAQKLKLNVATAGTLSTLVANSPDVEKLILSGTLNDNDLRCIRSLKNVREINLTKVKNLQLGDSAFFGMKSLEYARLPKKLNKLGRSAFEGCENLAHLDFPGHLENIPENMLKDCKSLDKIYLSNSYVKNIGKGAFMNSGLRIVAMPELLRNIEMTAFANCEKLEMIRLPKWVSEIGALAFANCKMLRSVKVENDTPPTCADDAFQGLDKCTLIVKHPEQYRDRSPWNKINLSYKNYNGEEFHK